MFILKLKQLYDYCFNIKESKIKEKSVCLFDLND